MRPDGLAQFVGSDVHVSCGLEIETWKEAPAGGLAAAGLAALGIGGANGKAAARRVELRLRAGRAVMVPKVWLHLPGTVEEQPPKVDEVGGGADKEALPPPQWVADGVWAITLASIGKDGLGGAHEILFSSA